MNSVKIRTNTKILVFPYMPCPTALYPFSEPFQKLALEIQKCSESIGQRAGAEWLMGREF